MLRIITGVPGSGKSYYAVNYLKSFIKYDKLYNTLLLDDSVLLVTNIEDIKVPHKSFKEWLELGMLNIDLTRSYMAENHFRRIIIIVDEAQKYFSGLKDTETYFFFEYHRHIGADIFLIVQSLVALPRRLTELSECVIDALPRVYAIIGFRYNVLDCKTGQKLETKLIKKDQDVFRIYKSFEIDEREKPKKIILRKALFSGGLFLFSIAFAVVMLKSGYVFKHSIPENQQKKIVKQENKTDVDPAAPVSSLDEKLISHDYIFIEDFFSNERPNGKIKGISQTSTGTYIFYR